MNPKFSIVIPSYTRSDKLRECLASIVQYTDMAQTEIIVVANGASEETRQACELYREFPVTMLWYPEPMGYPFPVNRGIEASKGEFVILLNDDALLLPQPRNEWVDTLVKPFSDPTVGITGPLELLDENSNLPFLVFFCVMIRRKTLDHIGLLDETFRYFGEDCDLCIRARRAGWQTVRVPEESPTELRPIDPNTTTLEAWKHDKIHIGNFRMFHDAESTIGRLPDSEEVLRESRKILRDRYGPKGMWVNSTVKEQTGLCECGEALLDNICIPCTEKKEGLVLWRAGVIDGWFGYDEGAQLARWTKALPKGARVLEVGSWHGRSSRFIADNLPEDGQVWCVDTWIGSSGEPEMHGSAHYDRGDHAHQWWWCNLQVHINAGRVVPVRMYSDNASHTIAHLIEKGEMEKFDLIFIDGDHSEEGIKTDVESWLPLLKDGGLMCGHDYYQEHEGPHWVHVRQYVEQKFPTVQKTATSLWYVRPHEHPQGGDEGYDKVVEHEHREMIGKWFADVPKDARILDVGCGSGVALSILREQGFDNAHGIDVVKADGITRADMHALPFESALFDVVYSSHSLEHASDPIKVLSEIRRVLKPEGRLLLILPYIDILYDEHRAKVHCGSRALGLDIADNGDTLLGILEDAGFTPLTAEGGDLRNESEIYIQLEKERSRIYDCFIFNDEFDVLEIRLATLYNHVDRFVLVEGALTHSGNPKPLHFEENKERFAKYLDKISHVIMAEYPQIPESETAGMNELDAKAHKAWKRERFQRDGIMHGLQGCKDDDIIIVGDADEIVNPEALKSYDVNRGTCRLKQRLFYYYLNCENRQGWDWQKIAPYKMVKELTPCGIRYPPAGDMSVIENAGWHFSFLGGTDAAIKKIRDYAHVEYANDRILNRERVEKLMSEGKDIFGRDQQYEFVPMDESYPQCVQGQLADLVRKGLWRVRSPRTATEAMIDAHLQRANVVKFRKPQTVTAMVSTKDRYQTTLPMCLSAIINQTRKPDKLKIYDDGEQANLFDLAPFGSLLRIAQDKGIEVEVLSTPRKGQVLNHQHCLDAATTDVVWRVDDDEVPEPDCLANLLAELKDGVGAVAGLVHHPNHVQPLPSDMKGTLDEVNRGSIQWFEWNSGPKEVEHLYSTFAYNVKAAKEAGGYPMELSPVGHREESIFSARINRAGYKLLVTPHAKTVHLREETGGIRSYKDTSMWDHDEQVFQEYLKAWGLDIQERKLAILDYGLGDTLCFKGVFDDLQRRNPRKWILSVCFPDVFKDTKNVTIISIAEAKLLVGHRYDEYSLYRWCWDRGWDKSIVDAMYEFYA